MKTVLIITHSYPPDNTGGSPRPYQFAKYLPKYGYKPIVISSNLFGNTDYENGIYRIEEYSKLINTSRLFLFLHKSIRKVLYETGVVSCHLYLWKHNVIKNIDKIIKDYNVEIIFATYPTAAAFNIGIVAKEKHHIPLVIDFRDGLVFEPWKESNFLRRITEKYFEKRFVDKADYIVTIAPQLTNYFKTRYEKEKVITITNGYDKNEFEFIYENQSSHNKPFTILYTGSLSACSQGQIADSFIDVVADLINSKTITNVKLLFLGKLTKKEISYFKVKLGDKFEYRGLVDRKEVKYHQKNANLLLFISTANRTSSAPTKLYEYIISGKPIFGITDKNIFASQIIQKTKTGICIRPNDTENMRKYLIDIIVNKDASWFDPQNEEIAKYDRDMLTKELANLLDKIIQSHKQ